MAHRTPRFTHAAVLVPVLLLAACGGGGSTAPQPAAAPTISSVDPAVGPAAGGNTVTILGTNFAATAQVSFGTTAAPVVSRSGSSIVVATAPLHAAGAVDIRVTNPDGQAATKAGAYSYVAPPPPADPVITAVSPPSGALAGGTTVIISGQNFVSGTGLAVRFGGVDATLITKVLAGAITAVTPAHAAGAVDVQVVNPDGRSTTRAGGFTYEASPPPPGPAPVLTSLAPTAGTTAGGTTVVLTGQNFVDGAGLAVLFGVNQAAVTAGSVTATSITVTTPAGNPGAADVTVVNPDGQSVTHAGAFTYQPPPPPAPVISGLSPASGTTAGGTAVTVTGQNFAAGAVVLFGATAVTPGSVSATSISVTTPPRGAGVVDVTVRNPNGQTSAPFAFTYLPSGPPAPTIASLAPNTGSTLGGQLCVITGTGFVTGMTTTFGGANAPLAPGSVVTSTTMSVVVPAHPAGPVDVTVSNPVGGIVTAPNAYTYVGPAPVVLALNVRGGPTAGGTQVLAVGTGFVTGVKVKVGALDATNVTLINLSPGNTAVSFFTPPQAEGLYDVTVTNPDGQFDVAPVQFHYGPAPVITSLACGGAGGCGAVRTGDLITITGDHFAVGAGEGVQVLVISADTTQQAFVAPQAGATATQLVIPAPKLDPSNRVGPYSIVVSNFDGQVTTAAQRLTFN